MAKWGQAKWGARPVVPWYRRATAIAVRLIVAVLGLVAVIALVAGLLVAWGYLMGLGFWSAALAGL